jgi:hypothetical protein
VDDDAAALAALRASAEVRPIPALPRVLPRLAATLGGMDAVVVLLRRAFAFVVANAHGYADNQWATSPLRTAGAEAVDALSVPSWNASACPGCGSCHREVFFAFPPAGLLGHFVEKARADGARGFVLTPTAVTGDHWGSLLQAAIPVGGEPFLAIKHPMRLLRHHNGFFATELALQWTLN